MLSAGFQGLLESINWKRILIMKELSIEEKAYDGNYKAYTELINRLECVKDAIKKQNYGIAIDVLCKPYPEFQVTTHSELKESEDERIRKAFREHLTTFRDNYGRTEWYGGIKIDDAIAWLENQGEQSPIDVRTTGYWHVEDVEQNPAWSEEDKRIIDNLISQLGNLYTRKLIKEETKDKYVNWLKSFKDRYTWKPSDEQMELLKEVQQALLGKDCHNRFVIFMYELKRLRGE